jgi:C-terminal processing protease CtpA/Prc
LFKFKNLIIDVRENSGGNESFAKGFASYFVKDPIPYEKVKSFNKKSGAFDDEHLKKLYPNERKLYYSGNIYVLSGPSVMSSNESFILMMKQLPNAKVIGMKTYGSSGNPLPHQLSNDVTIYLPSWQAYTLDGILIEGNGIKPDIEMKTTRKDFEDKDILIEEVLKMKQLKTN